jgi:hypothetical protein
MADISIVSRLISGIHRDIDLTNNSLVVGSIKIGSTSPAEITKTIAERLISLQNGSDVDGTYHTHDGRYYTKTQLSSSTVGFSGAKVIGVSGTPTNFTPASSDAQAYFDAIDSALATAGGTAFSDALFGIYDDADITKQLKFQLSPISTGETRIITMADEDVDLADVNQAILQDGSRPMLATLDMNGNQVLNLGVASAASHAVRFDQFQAAIAGLDFQADVLDYVLDASTTSPGNGLPSAASGQRYILASGTGALDAGWGAIAGVGNNDIVQYTGSVWVVAYDVSVQGPGALVWNRDDVYFMRYDGTSWSEFGGLAGITAGNGLTKTGNTLDLNFNEMAASAIAVGDELAFGDVSDTNIVKKITMANFNAALDHDTLANYVANEHVDHSAVQIATAAGSGLSGGGDITTTRNLVVDITGQTSEPAVSGLDEVMFWDVSASARRKATVDQINTNRNEYFTAVAGESYAADTTFAVRFAISGETSGRIYKADFDASSTNKFYVVGYFQSSVAVSAGDTISVLKTGRMVLGANDTAFGAGVIGQPVHLKAAGAFGAVSTITYTSNQASFMAGIVENTTTIFVDAKQLHGIAG